MSIIAVLSLGGAALGSWARAGPLTSRLNARTDTPQTPKRIA
jgi:hypothetical protein